MADAILDANAKFQLERHPGLKGFSQHLFGVGAIFRHHGRMPELPGGFNVRGDLVQLKHPLIPADHVRLEIPLPYPDATGFVREGDTLHQTLIDPLGLFQVVDIFNLGNKVERGAVGMAHNGDGQQRPHHLAAASVVAFFEAVAIDLPVNQLSQLLQVGI